MKGEGRGVADTVTKKEKIRKEEKRKEKKRKEKKYATGSEKVKIKSRPANRVAGPGRSRFRATNRVHFRGPSASTRFLIIQKKKQKKPD